MNQPANIAVPRSERRRIRVRGLVQGVGFRPHVCRCARDLGISGFVGNDSEGVLIEAEGENLDVFLHQLRDSLPPLARIDSVVEQAMSPTGDRDFSIAPTTAGAATGAAIPADTALCGECLQELFDPGNRRYLHPFIACSNCGPRYTMTRELPYDRVRTAMAEFELCHNCQREYEDTQDRRFHAEPVACHRCGPGLSGPVAAIATAIRAGEIVAIKGLGGYHLACDARNRDAVQRLRASKKRDGKPFAVMVLNRACAARHIVLDAVALALLESGERPVVIAARHPPGHGERGKQAAPSAAADDQLAALSPDLSPGMDTLGVMLPYTPVHYLLFHALLGEPHGLQWLSADNNIALVMTSANLSGNPLIADTQAAEADLAGLADRFLHHDREIAARADDSVVRAAAGRSMIVRRARGYTPHAVKLARRAASVLALGPHLKTTVTMTRGDRAYISPHVGDLETPAALTFHAETARAMVAMLRTRPERIACDLGRDLASTRLAQRLSEEWDLPLHRVQHHHAHVAAVLAEHSFEAPVLGLALDGHGEGPGGEAWGGELLRVDGAACERLGHLSPLPLPGGDRAAREPWRMAAAALHQMGRAHDIEHRFACEPLAVPLAQLLETGAVVSSTSAGRLFDAAAGLLGISTRASFEGEPPMRLEALAGDRPFAETGLYTLASGVLAFTPLLEALADCDEPAGGARLFHDALVEGLAAWVIEAARVTGLNTIALGGGCFLNARLTRDLPLRLGAAGLGVLLPVQMPPNDGAISLGQAWVAQRSD